MNILKRFLGDKKKLSLSDGNGFLRLQTEEMEAILGGRPSGLIITPLVPDDKPSATKMPSTHHHQTI